MTNTTYPLVEYQPARDPESPIRMVLWSGNGVDCVEVEWAARLHERLGAVLAQALGRGCSKGETCCGGAEVRCR